MSTNTKKQSLLGKAPRSTKTTKNKQNRSTATKPNNIKQSANTSANNKAAQKSKSSLLTTLGLLLFIIIIIPKPTLLSYHKLGMVSNSIYWPGVFGYGATLLDSNLQPQLDSKRKALYLCTDTVNSKSCQKYKVIADNGIIAAIKAYF
ncbi:hypothetical protein PNIG_a1098 [Pseudoalteromonas nigrifaciens]|nr:MULTISPECIES: hypothetical protein [Pseudoalteromonas]ASM53314.1 hypothetical protein PNIG_a1098 [Pseudoalteromonas nigrifaciens]MBO7925809.1 hypothetical protein [Pseudoalteromonas sp. K222D]GEN40977.1 hypothetical protein PNI02_04430 [Pseudoalteromonas nigrifaciens]